MTELNRVRPANPLEWLASFLTQQAPSHLSNLPRTMPTMASDQDNPRETGVEEQPVGVGGAVVDFAVGEDVGDEVEV